MMIAMTEEDFKEKLTPEEYRILRQQGTEAPFTGKYVNEHAEGTYRCRACGAELFSSSVKFDSGTGWPSFTEPVNRANVELREDRNYGMNRVEVRCGNCGSHLGHVFDDGPSPPAGGKGEKRYCINSTCLELEKKP
ncbi:MAG: peptide-methionine (R)-S-oxide reductase MsrB [Candidatus Brennerbacteria bacterium]|nr:peptide-methionine (R)-S-oxide reductase MsrB [Candidatus Brennerbacteria bacterium]